MGHRNSPRAAASAADGPRGVAVSSPLIAAILTTSEGSVEVPNIGCNSRRRHGAQHAPRLRARLDSPRALDGARNVRPIVVVSLEECFDVVNFGLRQRGVCQGRLHKSMYRIESCASTFEAHVPARQAFLQ